MSFDLHNFALGALSTGAAAAFFVWMLKESLKAALARSAQRDLERHRNELQQLSDVLRHDLQKEMLKAQLDTARTYEVYPALMEEIRKAEGAVGGLIGAGFHIDWSQFDEEDFEKILRDRGVPSAMLPGVVEVYRRDRAEGARLADATMQKVERQRARVAVQHARNSVLLKTLFISEEVRTACDSVLGNLWSAWVDIDLSHELPGGAAKARETLKLVSTELRALEKLMRAELAPRASNALLGSGKSAGS